MTSCTSYTSCKSIRNRKLRITTVETCSVLWMKRDFLRFYPCRLMLGRRKSDKRMDKCFSCDREFQIGEMMAIANFGERGNETLCQACSHKLRPVGTCDTKALGGAKSHAKKTSNR